LVQASCDQGLSKHRLNLLLVRTQRPRCEKKASDHCELTLNLDHRDSLAAPVFIVLSGYCLMLPVARSLNAHLPRGEAARAQ